MSQAERVRSHARRNVSGADRGNGRRWISPADCRLAPRRPADAAAACYRVAFLASLRTLPADRLTFPFALSAAPAASCERFRVTRPVSFFTLPLASLAAPFVRCVRSPIVVPPFRLGLMTLIPSHRAEKRRCG